MINKILLAEDNLMNCKLMQLSLKQYDVDVAHDGQEAIDLFSTTHYDVVLMDIQMPVKTGIEATYEIRELEKQQGRARCIILGMTADWIPAVEEQCKTAGIDDFLPKPFLPSEVSAIIEEKYRRINETKAG